MEQYIYEVIEKVAQAKTNEEKVKLLHKNNSIGLRNILKITYDKSVKWLIPDNKPPYEPNDGHNAPSNLLKKTQDLTLCVAPRGNQVKPYDRESIFIGVLESIHPKDAEIMVDNVLKHKPFKGLTSKVVREAFPNLAIPE